MGVQSLAAATKSAVERRINEESKAQRGTICNGRLQIGAKSYPYTSAVDVGAHNGDKVWAQLTPSGKAVIVGN